MRFDSKCVFTIVVCVLFSVYTLNGCVVWVTRDLT